MEFKAIQKFRNDWQPAGLLVMRVVFGYVFLLHGLAKFGVLSGTFGWPPNGLMLAAGLIEVIGGVLLILGLCTTTAAFIASGELAVAYFLGHVASKGTWWSPLANGGEPAVLLCFGFLLLFFLGPGAYSLDAKCCKR